MGVSAPETSSAGEDSYVDKTTGRVASFTPKSDEAMVTFRDSATPDTLNEIVELNQEMAREFERVGLAVGKEGRITQRANLGGAGGSWAASINSMISI